MIITNIVKLIVTFSKEGGNMRKGIATPSELRGGIIKYV